MERTERLAIWLEDLDRIPASMKAEILPKLDLTKLVRAGREDTTETRAVVEFKCPLLEAALICDIIRNHDRLVGDRPSEIYINRGVSWVRVIYAQVLTVLVNGKASLHPQFFPSVQVVPIEEGIDPKPLVRRKNA